MKTILFVMCLMAASFAQFPRGNQQGGFGGQQWGFPGGQQGGFGGNQQPGGFGGSEGFGGFGDQVMSDPPSKSFHETLAQDHENQENASAQELPLPYSPPPAYTETKGASPSNMIPPPEYNETPSSSINCCYLYKLL
uniref:Uncharacterized protein n=1 Tax=Acrobeloides nanus TaxID=290746 RepID=A0A914DXL7_9BILA